MGGLGRVTSLEPGAREGWPTWLGVTSSQPVLACLASQYAGWSLAASKEETGGKKFFALGSGPARALAGKEKLFGELGYRDRTASGVLVLEVGRAPPAVVVDKVLREAAGLAPEGLDLHPDADNEPRRHDAGRRPRARGGAAQGPQLGFALGDIVEGSAAAPLPPPAPTRQGDGPHQRRDPLRRPGAALRARPTMPRRSGSPSAAVDATRATTGDPSPCTSSRG